MDCTNNHKGECWIDRMEFGKLLQRIDDKFDEQGRFNKEIREDVDRAHKDIADNVVRNALNKRVSELESNRNKIWGGLAVVGVIVPLIVAALIKWGGQ